MRESLKIEWDGESFVIPAGGIMRALALVEASIHPATFAAMCTTGNLRYAVMAFATSRALRAAGAHLEPEDIYPQLFTPGGILEAVTIVGSIFATIPRITAAAPTFSSEGSSSLGFAQEAFKLATGSWGMAPSEFWRMHPAEFCWMLEARRPTKMYGSMTEHEVAAIYREEFGSEGIH